MSRRPRIVLVNPRITSPRSARFPLAILALADALEDRYDVTLVDGNVEADAVGTTLRAIERGGAEAVGVSVMGGPQLPTALALSRAVRGKHPHVPIAWGGYFPTVCPDATLREDAVDYAVRGQGEDTLRELLEALARRGNPCAPDVGTARAAVRAAMSDTANDMARAAMNDTANDAVPAAALSAIDGLSWRRGGAVVHNRDRAFSAARIADRVRFDLLEDPGRYLGRTYLGRRTAGYQAALGCRFRCTFCGVANAFRGRTALAPAERVARDLAWLRDRHGLDSVQFYDHNFFDREADMVPLLESLARLRLPWWCFARADALVNLSASAWSLVRRSRLRMAYIGAESPSDWLLHDVRKGTRTDQTLAAVEVCRRNGVIPELSFMVAPPNDPAGETEKTFEFIRLIKRRCPETEIVVYVYTPLPFHAAATGLRGSRLAGGPRDADGRPVVFPATAQEWTEPRWLDYWCHRDAPWLTERLRHRIADFTTVLGCRFPTITDVRSPPWGKQILRGLAAWRYGLRRYDRPWELDLSRRFIRLWDPSVSSL